MCLLLYRLPMCWDFSKCPLGTRNQNLTAGLLGPVGCGMGSLMDAQLRWDLASIECLVVVVLLKPHFCGVVRLLPLGSAVAMGRVLIGLQQSSQSCPKRWTNWHWLHQHSHSTSCHVADTSCQISCVYKILSVMSFCQTLWCTVSCYITILHPYYLYISQWSDTSWSLPHVDTSCSNVLMKCSLLCIRVRCYGCCLCSDTKKQKERKQFLTVTADSSSTSHLIKFHLGLE